MGDFFCETCQAWVPAARVFVGRLVGAALGAYLGRNARTTTGKAAVTLAGLAGGWVVDATVGARCASCRRSLPG